MSHEVFVKGAAAVGSLAGYYLAKNAKVNSWYPYVVIGGVIGAALGELIIQKTRENSKHIIS